MAKTLHTTLNPAEHCYCQYENRRTQMLTTEMGGSFNGTKRHNIQTPQDIHVQIPAIAVDLRPQALLRKIIIFVSVAGHAIIPHHLTANHPVVIKSMKNRTQKRIKNRKPVILDPEVTPHTQQWSA